MNLRIDGKSLRLRITREELTAALAHGAAPDRLETLRLPGGAGFRYGFTLVSAAAGRSIRLRTEPGAWVFEADRRELAALLEQAPSKDLGLRAAAEGDAPELVLEVDLFSEERRKRREHHFPAGPSSSGSRDPG